MIYSPFLPRFFNVKLSVARLLAPAVLLFGTVHLQAQHLEHVPPIIANELNKDNKTAILLSTADLGVLKGKEEKNPFASSLQILDANQSWPPRWFYSAPVYTNAMRNEDMANHELRVHFIEGPVSDANVISYASVFCSTEGGQQYRMGLEFISYFKLLNKQMELADSIMHVGRLDSMSIKTTTISGALKPGFKTDSHAEELVVLLKDSVFDLSSISGSAGDKNVEAVFNCIQIMDHNNNVKFSWNPMELNEVKAHIKDWATRRAMGDHMGNSLFKIEGASFDSDGNLLYSIEKVGFGKVSRKDGHVMWHFDLAKGPVISGKDTVRFYAPANFTAVADADTAFIYSVLEHGVDSFPVVRGVVFEQNKKTLGLKVIKYINSTKPYRSREEAQKGNFDFNSKTGEFLIEYGQFEVPDTATSAYEKAFEYGKNGNVSGTYLAPKWNFMLGAHKLENWPLPSRPVIRQNGKSLEAQAEGKSFTWYKLDGLNYTSVKEVGNGAAYRPEGTGTYCVVVPYGIGYSVSIPFAYKP